MLIGGVREKMVLPWRTKCELPMMTPLMSDVLPASLSPTQSTLRSVLHSVPCLSTACNSWRGGSSVVTAAVPAVASVRVHVQCVCVCV